jgi:hypothetical protein
LKPPLCTGGGAELPEAKNRPDQAAGNRSDADKMQGGIWLLLILSEMDFSDCTNFSCKKMCTKSTALCRLTLVSLVGKFCIFLYDLMTHKMIDCRSY